MGRRGDVAGPRARTAAAALVAGLLAGAGVLGAASAPAAAATEPGRAALPPLPLAVDTAPAAPLRQAEDLSPGLRVEESVAYTADLAAAVVHVAHTITLTNETPDEVTATYIREFYFPEYAVPVLAGATNVAARRGDRGLAVRTEPADGFVTAAVVDLSPDLQYGQTHTIELTYDLPEQPPRSGAAAQVNQAFATFPVFTSADPGLATITVTLPAGLDVDVVGSPMDATAGDGVVVHTAAGIADPGAFFATVLARDDLALVEREVVLGDDRVRIQAWPGDTEWLDFTADLAERGLPALEDVIGIPWPVVGRLDVVETVAPYVYGYGGWFDPASRLIEVGDALDAHVTLHEMAHAWLNQAVFDGRWIYEALADEFSALAMAELGLERPTPDPPVAGAPGALPLNAWVSPDLDAPQAREQEAYGYGTSWWVARSLTDEIGAEGLAAVVQAAAAYRSPYPAGTADADLGRVTDWRTFLDLLEETGGSTGAEQLFRDLVVAEADLPLLDARAAARAEYAALVAAADGWAPPALVREPMTDWDFDVATAAMPDVAGLLERRDAVADRLAPLGEELSAAVQREFETGDDIGALRRLLGDLEAASGALVDGAAALDGAGPLARLGLLVVDAEDDLDAARAALRHADFDAATAAAELAADRVATATLLGGVGVAVLVLVLAAVVVAVLLVRRRRRGARPIAPSISE